MIFIFAIDADLLSLLFLFYSVASSMFLYAYFAKRNSPEAQAQSKYYQRFLAPKKDH